MDERSKPPRQEFERKFLVIPHLLPALPEPRRFRQGYLYTKPTQVRIRIIDDKEAFCQIKGTADFESAAMPLPLAEAEYLLKYQCEPRSTIIIKDHYALPAGFGGLEWELHVFREENEGLIIAELETPTKSHTIPENMRPAWLGREVTGEKRFKNKVLTFHPFLSWPEEERRDVIAHPEA